MYIYICYYIRPGLKLIINEFVFNPNKLFSLSILTIYDMAWIHLIFFKLINNL